MHEKMSYVLWIQNEKGHVTIVNYNLKETSLYSQHLTLNAKIVDFAGFKMPISYSSVTDEHNHVRENVGVFDVSHMGEFEISGKNSTQFIQFICSNNISAASRNNSLLGK